MTMLVPAINELSATCGPLLWKASWQGGLALLLMLFLSRLVRSIPANVQCWFWRLAFLKLLIAGLWIAPVELHCLAPTSPVMSTAILPTEPVSHGGPEIISVSANVPPEARQASFSQLSGLSWLVLAWMAGVSIFLARLIKRLIQVRSMTSHLTIVTEERVQHAVDEHCRQMGISRPPKLCVAKESCSPYLVGSFRPLIVLPPVVLQSCSDAERRAALIHELAHVRRRDLLWNWMPALAEVLFFFHPLVWPAQREWRLSQEMAADELAISSSRVSVTQYANALVELIAKCPTVNRYPHMAISMSPAYSQIQRRMIAMQSIKNLTKLRRCTAAATVLAIGVLSIVPWKLVAQDSPAAPTQNLIAAETQDDTEDNPQSVRGMVVDAEGRPIPGAAILAASFGRPQVRQSLTTDSDGRFETQLDKRLMPLVVAHKEGMALASHWFSDYVGPASVTLTLTKPVTFVGKVQDPDGNPIPRANVRVEIISTEEGFTGWNHLIEQIVLGTALDQYANTTTNAEGEFRFSALPENAGVALKIQAEGWSLLRTISFHMVGEKRFLKGTIDNPAVLTLAEEGIVEGRVTTGMAEVSVEGLTVHLQESHNSPVIAEPGFVKTDADGRFRFAGLAKGTANVFLTNHEPDEPWTYRAAADVLIIPGERLDVEIELIEGQFVEGEVIDPEGKPVAGAHVGVYGPIRPDSGGAIIGCITKSDGKYRFHLPSGQARIYISGQPTGYTGRGSGSLDVPDGVGTIPGPTFTLKPTIGMQGRFVENDGQPATGIAILRVSSTVRSYDFSRKPIWTDSDGRFELRRDDPVSFAAGDQLRLRILSNDGQEIDVKLVPRAEEESEIRLPKADPARESGSTIRNKTIRVVDQSGAAGRRGC